MTYTIVTGSDRNSKDTHARAPMKPDICEPVWLFSDDLQELTRLLGTLGPIESCTDAERLNSCSQVVDKLPVKSLCLSVPEIGMSVMLFPRQTEIRWAHHWNPSIAGADTVEQVRDFMAARRHPLFILSKRGWQVAAGLLSFALLLPVTVSHLLRGEAGNLTLLPAIGGVILGPLVFILALVGTIFPHPTHVTLWAYTREEFAELMIKAALYSGGGCATFILGLVVGSLDIVNDWLTMVFPAIGLVLGAVMWLVGRSMQTAT